MKRITRTCLSESVRRLDRVFSRYIRGRDESCITCGATQGLQCGHFVGRSAMPTRWDERNCNAQCAECNMHYQGDFDGYKFRIDEKWGEGVADELIMASKQIRKYMPYELEGMIKCYGEKLR